MRVLAAIAIAGALGAATRYAVDGLISSRGGLFPLATLVINITGSFALGIVVTVATTRAGVQPWLRAGIATGFIGAYTTFSTWMVETVQLAQEGEWVLALASAGGSVATGLLAVVAGMAVGQRL